MHYCFIVNNEPSKKGNLPEIERAIRELGTQIDYQIYCTTDHGSAIRFVRDYCNTHQDTQTCFVACGGDGTINEVATGMVGSSGKHLAVLAYGSGNDFVKYYKGKDFRNLESLVNGTPHNIDIIRVNNAYYSINVCNFGFDADVAWTANKLSRKGFRNPYRWGIARAFFTSRFNSVSVTVDGEPINPGKRMLFCTLGNNDHLGGEFYCSPRAVNDDGLIEVGYCKTISIINFIRLISRYANGTHLDDPVSSRHFIYRRARKVTAHSNKEMLLCLDGELIKGTDFSMEIIPQAISFIIPA